MRRNASARSCDGAERLADLGQAGAQLRVADLDGPHRVLQLGELLVGLRGRVGRVLDQLARLRGGVARLPRRERARLEAVALGEAVCVRRARP